MKILHTSDLHLGRQFNGLSLDEDHAAILDQIVSALQTYDVDVLIIAGDIYDRAAPPASAVRQFNAFLSRVKLETGAAVVMIAGNHDSGDRIASMAVMTDDTKSLIRGVPLTDEPALVLEDESGPVAFSGLPFTFEYAARECFGAEDIASPQAVLSAQMEAARRRVPADARWVVTAHAFVTGATISESERSLTRVGGVETVSADTFEGSHYVALGHLHRPQSVGAPHIRYSGSPLAFGFDEAQAVKSMTLVELDGDGAVHVDTVAFAPVRAVQVLTGRHSELLQLAPSEDFVRAVLTDPAPVIDAMKRLRSVFPNACEMTYERPEPETERKGDAAAAGPSTPTPLGVTGGFLQEVRGSGLSEREQALVSAAIDILNDNEAAQ